MWSHFSQKVPNTVANRRKLKKPHTNCICVPNMPKKALPKNEDDSRRFDSVSTAIVAHLLSWHMLSDHVIITFVTPVFKHQGSRNEKSKAEHNNTNVDFINIPNKKRRRRRRKKSRKCSSHCRCYLLVTQCDTLWKKKQQKIRTTRRIRILKWSSVCVFSGVNFDEQTGAKKNQ